MIFSGNQEKQQKREKKRRKRGAEAEKTSPRDRQSVLEGQHQKEKREKKRKKMRKTCKNMQKTSKKYDFLKKLMKNEEKRGILVIRTGQEAPKAEKEAPDQELIPRKEDTQRSKEAQT